MNTHANILAAVLVMLVSLITMPSELSAQTNNTRHYNTPRVYWHQTPRAELTDEGRLAVNFSVEIAGRLQGKSQVRFLPLYVSGNDTVSYPPLVVATRRGFRYARRRDAVLGYERDVDAVNVVKSRIGSTIALYHRLPDVYPAIDTDSAQAGRLMVCCYLETCCDSIPMGCMEADVCTKPTATALPLVDPLPEPKAECAPSTQSHLLSLTLRIAFPVAEDKVLADFNQNAVTLSRLDSLLNACSAGNCHILSIDLTGYASPDGTYNDNLKLSLRRAQNTGQWLKQQHDLLAHVPIRTGGHGENWEELRHLLTYSEMAREDEVIDLIDNTSIVDGREGKLMQLHNGETYRYMKRCFFPALCYVELKVLAEIDDTQQDTNEE